MILDTIFLIDIMRKDENACLKLKILGEKGESIFISVLSVFELHSGLARSEKTISTQNKVKEVLEQQLILPLDSSIAEKAGNIHGTLILEGKMLDSMDCLIAATALLNGEPVLTRNVKDFSKVKGLHVEPY